MSEDKRIRPERTGPLSRAIALAATAHDKQVDKGGEPYILHPLRVMQSVKGGDDVRIVAVLHDVLEDSKVLRPCDIARRFGPIVRDAVVTLTRKPKENYREYIERIALDPIAVEVKVADLTDNLDLSRLKRPPNEDDLARVARYTEALFRLCPIMTANRAKAEAIATGAREGIFRGGPFDGDRRYIMHDTFEVQEGPATHRIAGDAPPLSIAKPRRGLYRIGREIRPLLWEFHWQGWSE